MLAPLSICYDWESLSFSSWSHGGIEIGSTYRK